VRNLKRIPICLKLLFQNKILHDFLNTKETKKVELISTIHQNWELIEKEWIKYPDYRFGQLLCNLNLVDKLVENIIWMHTFVSNFFSNFIKILFSSK